MANLLSYSDHGRQHVFRKPIGHRHKMLLFIHCGDQHCVLRLVFIAVRDYVQDFIMLRVDCMAYH